MTNLHIKLFIYLASQKKLVKLISLFDYTENKQIEKGIKPTESARIKLEDFSDILKVTVSLNYKTKVTSFHSRDWAEIIQNDEIHCFLIKFENNKLTMTPINENFPHQAAENYPLSD